jgi:glycerophosphoryl diester phosphodiesterase
MVSFKGAVAAGTHALETDVHVTKDEVVVLSHDPGLKRCFGVDRKIKDCSWEEVRECRTVGNGDGKGKGEPMPRLKDILEYLAQSGLEDIWLMLDIKLSNDAPTIMRLLGETISSTPSSSSTLDSDGGRKAKPWSERIVLGIWAAKYLPLALNHLPSFSVIHIGFSLSYSRHFFSVPNVSFNMLLAMLMAPGGKKFLRDAREVHHRLVYAWTVNEKDKMEWCIRRKLDGVVTDDVGKFLEVCERFDESRRVRLEISLRGYFDMVMIYAWVSVAAFLFRNWLKPVASQALIRKRSVDGGKKGGS